jgi:hypothetical protein
MVATVRQTRLHPAWVAAGVAFVALLCAAGSGLSIAVTGSWQLVLLWGC